MSKVLFVCTGNICRSPTAEGVLRKRAAEHELVLTIASAGTHGHYHEGEPPDQRAIKEALNRGYDIREQRARLLKPEDYASFELILALDEEHLDFMRRQCPAQHRHKLHLLMDFAPELGLKNVPDPYYGSPRGFAEVLDMIEAAVDGVVNRLNSGQEA